MMKTMMGSERWWFNLSVAAYLMPLIWHLHPPALVLRHHQSGTSGLIRRQPVCHVMDAHKLSPTQWMSKSPYIHHLFSHCLWCSIIFFIIYLTYCMYSINVNLWIKVCHVHFGYSNMFWQTYITLNRTIVWVKWSISCDMAYSILSHPYSSCCRLHDPYISI